MKMRPQSYRISKGAGQVSLLRQFIGLETHTARKEYSVNCFTMIPTVFERLMNWLGHEPQPNNTHMKAFNPSEKVESIRTTFFSAEDSHHE